MSDYGNIRMLRESVYRFIHEKILPEITSGKNILEIGPAVEATTPHKDLYVDIKSYAINAGAKYVGCDISKEYNPDIVSDVLYLEHLFTKRNFDIIIALEVLEHTSEFWRVPKVFSNLLKKGGKIFVSTPFMFLWHDPKPDYWRFSPDGLEYLFKDLFKDVYIERTYINNDVRMPLHLTLTGIKA